VLAALVPAEPHVAVFAGEPSGDVQAAHLLGEMRRRRPELRAWGVGGPALAGAGVALLADSRHWGAIGLVEAVKVAFRLAAPLQWSLEALAQRRPDLVVLVDFGAFNKHLARRAHELGLKVFWYFPPGSWSRQARVGRELAECVDAVATPFPWSEQLLRGAGANAHFVGHPLLDVARPREPRAAFRARLGIPEDAPVVAYFPGSRRAEVRHIWPAMAGAAQRISGAVPSARHVVGIAAALADGKHLPNFESAGALPTPDIYDLLNACDAVVTKSGTVTLETTLFERPMVIMYRASAMARLEYMLWQKRRIRWIGMPNILADTTLCPELLGPFATPEAIAAHVIPWLTQPEASAAIRAGLREVKALLGEPGGVGRAADLALGLVSTT
jgi:lipid-A-disaccharide synthase